MRPAIDPPSLATNLATQPIEDRNAFLEKLSPNALAAMPYLWSIWARPDGQLPPPGDWTSWLILGGRGSGKTRAGAEWVRAEIEGSTPLAKGKRRRLALVAETADQARDVMVLGESGLLAVTPPDRRPTFNLTRRHLEWPNGAEAWLFSASDPESLRGPQFDGAWCDELAKWRKTAPAWDMLQFGLRLGPHPQQVITTTPRPNPVLIALMEDPTTVITRSPTQANVANLAPGFIARMKARYGGRALGRQELDGELLLEMPGALWPNDLIEASHTTALPDLDRIIVAVDPPVTGRISSDACGIIVAGRVAAPDSENAAAIVLADWSVGGKSPRSWAERAITAYRHHNADRLVAEVNQGGDMVEEIIRQVDPDIAFRAVRATRGKVLRAEPVAALYEQGRVRHLLTPQTAGQTGGLAKLEDQMRAFGAERFTGNTRSPDRVDALVWAITELLLTRQKEPRVRGL